MALSDPLVVSINAGGMSRPVVRCSVAAQRIVAIEAGGIAAADNSGVVTNPDVDIDGDGRVVFAFEDSIPSLLRVQLGYDDGLTAITDAEVIFWGKHGEDGVWYRLRNLNNSYTITLTTSASDDGANDSTDGTLLWTNPDNINHTIDTDGCTHFVLSVKTALNGTGSEANAVVVVWGLNS